MISSFFLILFAFTVVCSLANANLSADVCVAKGFDQTVLNCKTCDKILKIVGDEEIVEDCKACCKSYADVSQRYELAVLEIDKRILQSLPEFDKIIKEAKKLKLTVKYRYGSRPTLFLFKKSTDESPDDSISVHTWNADTFREFLSENLLSSK